MQNRIRELCRQLLDTTNADDVQPIVEELQAAVHEYIDSLRLRNVVLRVRPSKTFKIAA